MLSISLFLPILQGLDKKNQFSVYIKKIFDFLFLDYELKSLLIFLFLQLY